MPNTIAEYRAAIDKLPVVVTERLAQTANATANAVAAKAASILRSTTHGTGRTAGEIRVIAEPERKQYRVNSPGDERWPNLPIGLEYGTRFMRARPYMRPAADSLTDKYRADMERAAIAAATDLLM